MIGTVTRGEERDDLFLKILQQIKNYNTQFHIVKTCSLCINDMYKCFVNIINYTLEKFIKT